MPWESSERGGFSSGQPWLPVPAQHRALSVASQERDPSSALHGFRRLLAWRRQQELLISGDIEFLAATDAVLAFRRFDAQGAILAAFNLSAEPARLALPKVSVVRAITGHGLPEGRHESGNLELPGHGVAFFQLAVR
jgi:alpha-glucosidase